MPYKIQWIPPIYHNEVSTPPSYNHPTNPQINDMENSAPRRRSSVATERNADVLYSDRSQPAVEGSWLERKLRPNKVSARYPIKGKALLFATCGFGSLGDALFGYNSGEQMPTLVSERVKANCLGIMSGLLINPVFISRFYSAYGGADGSTEAVNQTIIGISVSCLQVCLALIKL